MIMLDCKEYQKAKMTVGAWTNWYINNLRSGFWEKWLTIFSIIIQLSLHVILMTRNSAYTCIKFVETWICDWQQTLVHVLKTTQPRLNKNLTSQHIIGE